MSRPGAMYPQAEPRAGSLIDAAAVPSAARTSASRALALCRKGGARAAVLGPRRLARADDLARAVALGLGARRASAVAGTAVPEMDAAATEIEVRRLLAAGASAVIVRRGRHIAGLIEAQRAARGGASVLARLERPGSREDDARLWLLRLA